MSARTTASAGRSGPSKAAMIGGGAVVLLVVAMALDTAIVPIDQANQQQGFNAEAYGEETFPQVQSYVTENAVPAPELAQAITEDRAAAGEDYGVPGGVGPIFPVTFTGEVTEASSNTVTVDVPDMPDETSIRVQVGPAINGTDLRDATGEISFGQFTNQIEYQNAGAALNTQMKEAVLADIDTGNLTGQTVSVTGVFQLINPANWMVTPVQMSVQ